MDHHENHEIDRKYEFHIAYWFLWSLTVVFVLAMVLPQHSSMVTDIDASISQEPISAEAEFVWPQRRFPAPPAALARLTPSPALSSRTADCNISPDLLAAGGQPPFVASGAGVIFLGNRVLIFQKKPVRAEHHNAAANQLFELRLRRLGVEV
jgi:hypothetical protein